LFLFPHFVGFLASEFLLLRVHNIFTHVFTDGEAKMSSTMRIAGSELLISLLLLFASCSLLAAFSIPTQQYQQQQQLPQHPSKRRLHCSSLRSSSTSTTESTSTATTNIANPTEAFQGEPSVNKGARSKTLGLLTFDLDDTLYPLAPVIDEANAAFARSMKTFGFPGIEPEDINLSSIRIRKDIAEKDGVAAASALSHTEIRKLAIRENMERVMLHRKLQECAEDWATNVDSLGPVVVASAKRCVLFLLFCFFPLFCFASCLYICCWRLAVVVAFALCCSCHYMLI
jgi:hypothetical protein